MVTFRGKKSVFLLLRLLLGDGARFERGGVRKRPCGTVSVGLSAGPPDLHPFAGVSDRRGAPTLRAGLPRPGRPFGNPPTTVGLM